MTVFLRMSVIVLALSLTAPLAAHQQKESITRVLFNERTGNIEVMHRFLIHDVEHAGSDLFDDGADVLGNSADADRFEAYVHSRFSLVDQNGVSIALAPVGNEIEGRFLWVYAEAPIPEGLTAVTVNHDALRDVWPQQTNLVNLQRDREVRSATFTGESREITIRF